MNRIERCWAALAMMSVAAASVMMAAGGEALAQGCSMCRTAVEGADDPLARGLSKSTMFMVSMPFAVVASIAGWLVFTIRRAKAGGFVTPIAGSPVGSGPRRPETRDNAGDPEGV